MGGLLHTLVALAWSVNLPPGSAVSLHSRPTARDCGRASAARSDGGETLSPSGTLFRELQQSSIQHPSALSGGAGEVVAAFDLPAPPDALVELVRRLRGGGIPFAASVTGIMTHLTLGSKIMGGMLQGWLRDEARDPVLYFLLIALWKDLRQDLRNPARKLDALIKEKDQRGLAASKALLLPDQGQGRTNCFFIEVSMPEGLPDLESKRFHLDVLAGSTADPDGQKLQLMYSNGPLRQVWSLDVPDGMVVDAAELAAWRWSFEVEESDVFFPIVRLALPGWLSAQFHRPPPARTLPPPAQVPSSDGAPSYQ